MKTFLTRDAAVNFFISHRAVAKNIIQVNGKFVVVMK